MGIARTTHLHCRLQIIPPGLMKNSLLGSPRDHSQTYPKICHNAIFLQYLVVTLTWYTISCGQYVAKIIFNGVFTFAFTFERNFKHPPWSECLCCLYKCIDTFVPGFAVITNKCVKRASRGERGVRVRNSGGWLVPRVFLNQKRLSAYTTPSAMTIYNIYCVNNSVSLTPLSLSAMTISTT